MKNPVAPRINVAMIATCKSNSGLTELQYHVGYEAGSKDKIHIRIAASNGNGKFNSCWWPITEIEKALAGIPAEATFTVAALKPVFAGRSTNTAYFVLAALLDCGLLRRVDPIEAGYVRNTPELWWKELSALIEAGTDLVPDAMGQSSGHSDSSPAVKAGKGAKRPTQSAAHV